MNIWLDFLAGAVNCQLLITSIDVRYPIAPCAMQVLELVYKNTDQIDSNLVTSIIVPAEDPDAADVFFRINNMVRQ